MSNRKQEKDRYNHLYKIVPADRSEHGWALCTYCGDPADTVDHCPPITRVEDYRAMRTGREMYLLVKSCRSCNTILSDNVHADIFERIDALKYRLKRSIKNHDHALQWSDEEIMELGKNLRSQIVSSMRKIEETQRRIDYRGGYKQILEFVKIN